MMARSTECQTAFGYGRCNSSNSIAPGTMNTKGMFWGSNDKTSGVKVFGMTIMMKLLFLSRRFRLTR